MVWWVRGSADHKRITNCKLQVASQCSDLVPKMLLFVAHWKLKCKQNLSLFLTNLSLLPDFLPMLLYVLIQCGIVSMEIEADYMWGLLHPCLLAGEGGYYLTTLSSAVHVLKSLIANSKSDSYLKSVSTNNKY